MSKHKFHFALGIKLKYNLLKRVKLKKMVTGFEQIDKETL